MGILTVLCGAFLLAEISGYTITGTLDDEWETFKADYGKAYEGDDDDRRRQIWSTNVEFINDHNREADKGQHSYRLGVNAFADMTRKERNALLRRNGPLAGNSKYCKGKADFKHGTLPESVDWRTDGYVTPVNNEGMCGSPWAFSAIGAVESRNAIYCPSHQLVPLSAQNLIDCSGKYGNYGCNGGFMDSSFGYIADNGGIDTEASYPYEAKDGKCRFNKTTIGAYIRGCVDLPKGNETAMQIIMYTNGPVSVGIRADLPSFDFYKSGVYDDPKCTPDYLDHAALVVGYGVMDGKKYWIVKNSWGVKWGLEGYILVARDHGNLCGITNLSSYPLMLCEF